jgi:transcriptional regulator with XRE-family HTH domain
MEEVARRIDKLLKQLEMSWADFGRTLGVSDQVLTNWKRRGVPERRFREIAQAFGLTLDQVAGIEPIAEFSMRRAGQVPAAEQAPPLAAQESIGGRLSREATSLGLLFDGLPEEAKPALFARLIGLIQEAKHVAPTPPPPAPAAEPTPAPPADPRTQRARAHVR